MQNPGAPGPRGRSGALAGLVAGLALVVGPAGVWAADAGTPVPAPAPPVAAAPPVTVPLPRIAEEPAAPAPPVRVRLPALGVDAPVTPVGVDDRGRMDVPFDIRTVGWYRFGPGPGATTGSAVLSGHVDDRDQGYGAFHRLGDLAPGDPVAVDLADGGVVSYRVDDRHPGAQGGSAGRRGFRAHRSAPAYAGDVRWAVRRRRTCVHGERGGGCAAGRSREGAT